MTTDTSQGDGTGAVIAPDRSGRDDILSISGLRTSFHTDEG